MYFIISISVGQLRRWHKFSLSLAKEYREICSLSNLFNGETALMHGLNKNYLLGSERFFEDVITLRLNFNRTRQMHTDMSEQKL